MAELEPELADDEELLQALSPPKLKFPSGYSYQITRAADFVLKGAHPERFKQLLKALDAAVFPVEEMVKPGGNRTKLAAAWDDALSSFGWGKRNISLKRVVDDKYVSSDRSHEIDMFAIGLKGQDYPGVACEMEWNNKDPFFDRDLSAFAALHTEGIIDVGIVITRGPELHKAVKDVIPGKTKKNDGTWNMKFGESTTHWNKLIPRVQRGGGGGCPLILIGIEPERTDDPKLIKEWHENVERLKSQGKGKQLEAFRGKVARHFK